jgi:predicted MPP superfamily phosphohydrolase
MDYSLEYAGVRRESSNGRTRNQLLGGATALASVGLGLASYAAFREPMRVQLDRLTLRMPGAQGRLPKRGLRILHLTDTHFRGAAWRETPKLEQIRRLTADMEYEVLVHTGDFLHNDAGLPNMLTLLDQLPKPRLASFAVLGNHDYMQYSAREMFGRSWASFNELEKGNNGNGYGAGPFRQVSRLVAFGRYFANTPLDLKRTGTNDTSTLMNELAARDIQVLNNRHIRLTGEVGKGDCVDLYIAGIDDLTEGAADLRGALADIPPAAPTLLLSHNPDIVAEPGIEQADVVLSGHTHGGQIVLPGIGAAHTHSECLTRREASGYLRRGATQLYISRGIGEGIPLRFAASPQIALVTLIPG